MLSTPTIDRPGPTTAAAITCDVVAQAMVLGLAAEIPALRKGPGQLGDAPLPNGLLRHVDEQTVVAVAAVLKAARDAGLDPNGFADWSVLAAPRFLGRAKFESSFPDYKAEGAWGVSPHLVPGHSLHSPSGTISLALKAHGGNLGIGGTIGGEHDALLAAATFLQAGWAEGVWVVLSGRTPDEVGEAALNPPGDYQALALALRPSRVVHGGLRLHIRPGAIEIEPRAGHDAALAELRAWISTIGVTPPGSSWRWDQGHPSTPHTHQPRSFSVRENS